MPTKLLLCLMSGMMMACNAAGTAPSAAAQAKLAPAVTLARQALEKGETPNHGARADAQGRLQVYIYVTDTSAATLAQLMQHGLADMSPSAEMGIVQGWIAMRDLDALAALTCVKIITLPRYAIPR